MYKNQLTQTQSIMLIDVISQPFQFSSKIYFLFQLRSVAHHQSYERSTYFISYIILTHYNLISGNVCMHAIYNHVYVQHKRIGIHLYSFFKCRTSRSRLTATERVRIRITNLSARVIGTHLNFPHMISGFILI